MSPFKVVYERVPPQLVKYVPDPADLTSVQEKLLQRDIILSKLKHNLHRAQQITKKNADQKWMDVEFNVGDKVLVKLQPYKQHSVALRKNQKLSLRYFGPFPIIERIGKVAYKLLLPETAKIHPVFHISQLKLCKGHHSQSYVPLPITSNDAQLVLQPAAILQSRVIIKGTKHVQQHLIQWEGLDNTQATWEDHTALESAFP
uniref:Chromo domain-containing protein n=1 Tax=Cajanus cajan TaxID=3821 RepID=A0A151UGY2_CAJCA